MSVGLTFFSSFTKIIFLHHHTEIVKMSTVHHRLLSLWCYYTILNFFCCNGASIGNSNSIGATITTSNLPTAYGLFGMSDNRFQMRIKQMTFQFIYQSVGEDDTGHIMMRPVYLEIVHRKDGRLNEPVTPDQILNCTVSVEPTSKYFAGSECPFHKVQRFDSGTKLSIEIDSMLEPLTKFYVFEEPSSIYYVRVSTRRTLSGRALVDIWTFDQNDVDYDIKQFNKVRCTEALERYYNYNKAERGKTIMRQIESGIDITKISTSIVLEKNYDNGMMKVKFPKPPSPSTLVRNRASSNIRRRFNHTTNTFTFDKLPNSVEIQSKLDDLFNYKAKATLSKEDLARMKTSTTTTTTTTTTTVKPPDFETVENIFGVKPTTSFESVESIMGSKPTTSFESVESIFNSKPTDSIESVESIMKREEPPTSKPKYDSKIEVKKIENIFNRTIDDGQPPNIKKEIRKIKRIFNIDQIKRRTKIDYDDIEGSGDAESKIDIDNNDDGNNVSAAVVRNNNDRNNTVTPTHTQNFITYIIILFILLAVIALATICHLFSVYRLLKYKRKTSYEDTIMLGSERINVVGSSNTNNFCTNTFEMNTLHRKQNDPLPNVPMQLPIQSPLPPPPPSYYNSNSLPCSYQNIYDSIIKSNDNLWRNNINSSYIRMDKIMNTTAAAATATYMGMDKKYTVYKSLPSIPIEESNEDNITNTTNYINMDKMKNNNDNENGYKTPTSIYKIPKPPRPFSCEDNDDNNYGSNRCNSTTRLLPTTQQSLSTLSK